MKIKREMNGFTLVEILLAIVILAIVLTLGYSLFAFGLGAVNRSIDTLDIESVFRQQASSIIQQVRNVEKISLEDQSSDEDFVPLNLSNHDDLQEGLVSFEIREEEGRYFLYFKLQAQNRENETEELESEILLNNIATEDIKGGTGPSQHLYYKKP